MKDIKKFIDRIFARKEKGIALLFTLGMLSLLLVLALSFASNSKIENKISSNMDTRTSANYLAQSAVNRALGLLYKVYGSTGTNVIKFEDIISWDSTVNTWDFLYLLNTTQNGQVVYNKIDVNYVSATTKPNWLYIREGTGTSDKIIGRMAYVVIQDSGKLDPSAIAVGAASPPPDEGSTSPKARPGREVNEMRLLDVNGAVSDAATGIVAPGTTLTAARATLLYTGDDYKRWGSLEKIFKVMSLDFSVSANDTVRKNLAQWFVLDNAPDPEVFWKDDDGNGFKITDELYHRFNLYRPQAEWNDFVTMKAKVVSAPVKFYQNPTNDSTTGIPWFQNWTTAVCGCSQEQIVASFVDYCDADSYAICDSFTAGNAPTYVGLEKVPYINEVEVQLDTPTLTTTSDGIGGQIFTMALSVNLNVETVNLYEDVTTTAPVYIDMEGSLDWTTGTNSAVTYTFSTTAAASTTNKSITSSQGDVPNANNKYTFSKFTSHKVLATFSETRTSNPMADTTNKITNFKVTKLYVRLGVDSSTLYDFAKIITQTPAVNNISHTSGPITSSRYYSFQVNDPRQNLEASEWVPVPDLADGANTTSGSLGGHNATTICKPQNTGATDTPAKNEDWEPALVGSATLVDGSNGTAGTKCNISTAFIRNARMQSPWELGCIHRGKAWQTLNIHTYYVAPEGSVADKQKSGVTPKAYADGDANILDMVKMIDTTDRPAPPSFKKTGNTMYTYGKVNLNTPPNATDTKYEDIFRPLFTGIKIDNNGTITPKGAYNDPANPTSCVFVKSAVANQLSGTATGIRAYTTTNGLFKRRSEVTKVPAFMALWASGGDYNSLGGKRRQDELVGKFINLTKAENVNEFTIIAVAQTIKDVGGNGADIYIPKDMDGNGAIDTAVNTANEIFGYKFKIDDGGGSYTAVELTAPAGIPDMSDPKGIKAQIGRYDPYADEILATQKILVTVVYDAMDKKFRITKFQYLNP